MTTIEAVQTVPLTKTPEGVIRITGTRVPCLLQHHPTSGATLAA